MMDKNNFFIKSNLENDLQRISELINSGVFNVQILRIFQESVFTEIMIKLNDLLQKLNQLNSRIDFKDDVTNASDITELVSNIRNAVCHMESGEHLLDKEKQIRFTFNIAYGKVNLISVGDKSLTSDYEDDICFFYGEKKIYIKRHIIRCLDESKKKIIELYSDEEKLK